MNAIVLQHQRRDRNTGIIITVLFHVALLILFLFIGMKDFDPRPVEEGLEVAMADFGTSELGMGNEENPDPGATASSAAAPADDTPEDVVTDDASDVVVVKPPVKPQVKPTDKPKDQPKPKDQVSSGLENAMSAWDKPNGSKPGGDGQDHVPGNVGIPTGDPSGFGTFGNGKGEWKLSGRGLGKGPSITDRPAEAGKVALNIWVDRSGKVTRVTQNLDKSTTTSQTLFNIAKKAALQCTFTAKADAAAEQVGLMVFVFQLQ
jgi:protein TonB